MSAGLPGLGLGGLFFIVSALLGPFVELRRSIRGESDRASWRRAGRQFALAAAMIAAVDGTLRLAYLGLEAGGIAQQPSQGLPTVLPLAPIAITGALLAAVLAAAKFMQVVSVVRSRDGGAIAAGRVRTLAAGAAVTAGWFALLLVGASELSPLAPTDQAPSPQSGAEASAAAPEGPGSDLVAATGVPAGVTEARRPFDGRTAIAGSPPPAAAVAPAEGQPAAAPPAATTTEIQPTLTASEPIPAAGNASSGSPAADVESSPSLGPPAYSGPPASPGPPPHSAAGGQADPPGRGHQAVAGTRNSTRVPPGRS